MKKSIKFKDLTKTVEQKDQDIQLLKSEVTRLDESLTETIELKDSELEKVIIENESTAEALQCHVSSLNENIQQREEELRKAQDLAEQRLHQIQNLEANVQSINEAAEAKTVALKELEVQLSSRQFESENLQSTMKSLDDKEEEASRLMGKVETLKQELQETQDKCGELFTVARNNIFLKSFFYCHYTHIVTS